MGELTIVIWDVQHGSAAYIRTPKDKHFVIDLGSGSFSAGDESFSPLLHLKNKYGVEKLDKVIITHPHTDHLDDILNFDKLDPKVLLRPKHLKEDEIRKANKNSDKSIIDKYLEINNRYNTPVNSDENPTNSKNNGGVRFYSFIPTNCGTSNINNHSIVTIIEYVGLKVIIPGDNEPASWKELLQNEDFIDAIKGADIFVASHHGRKSGYYADLFKHFKPRLVIISDKKAGDTNISSTYSSIATGWKVYMRSKKEDTGTERYCITTRKDGTVVIKIGEQNNEKYLNVTID